MKKEKRRHGRLGLKLVLFLLLTVTVLLGLYRLRHPGPPSSLEQPWESLLGSLSPGTAEEVSGEELLLLVNPWNPLPEGYTPELHTLSDGTQVAESCYPSLRDLLNDCRAAGNAPYICSGYRTEETQRELYENKIRLLMESGLGPDEAAEEAAKVVAYPGTSEHQTGLAVDLIDSVYTSLDQGQEQTATQQWLMENGWKYGFILRYPSDKSDVTGIIYEPWHYRYVGEEAAAEMHKSGLCLEEYLETKNGAG
ncbi:MAG: M15 family metallopeptidase [Oscillospiraceae bacterium]